MPGRKPAKTKTAGSDELPKGSKKPNRVPLPSSNPATNLLIADIVVRGASTLLRKSVDKRVVRASADSDEEANKVLSGRTILTTIGLYGASKIATRSLPGLALVTGGLVAKTLYDRGRVLAARKRLSQGKAKPRKLPSPKE